MKYKVGESLRVVHELEVDGAPWLVASRTFRDGRSASVYERALAEARRRGPAARRRPRPGARDGLLDVPQRPQARDAPGPPPRHGHRLAAARPPDRPHRPGRLRAREVRDRRVLRRAARPPRRLREGLRRPRGARALPPRAPGRLRRARHGPLGAPRPDRARVLGGRPDARRRGDRGPPHRRDARAGAGRGDAPASARRWRRSTACRSTSRCRASRASTPGATMPAAEVIGRARPDVADAAARLAGALERRRARRRRDGLPARRRAPQERPRPGPARSR